MSLLNGVATIDMQPSSVPNVPMVDARQIRRWGIDEKLLPADTVVKFREPSAWDRYRSEISAGIAILLMQAGLIGLLLVERRSRQRTASALHESQEQVNLAARAARLSLWIWDVARDRLWASAPRRPRAPPGAAQVIDFNGVLETTHPADREALDRAVRRALDTGEEFDVEYRRVEPDGTLRWIAARGRAEGLQHLLGVALDVTDRKRSEMQAAEDRSALQHMTRVSMLGQLSAAIAHQVNQPLAAILGNAEAAQKMLSRDEVDLEELRAICRDIISDDHRASEVIRRLGELYKRGDLSKTAVDLNDLVRETLDLVRTELVTRHVGSTTELEPELPRIQGGRVQLQQVLLNLILNAADAMRTTPVQHRRFVVRTESTKDEVRFCVVDHGTGIGDDARRNMFHAFWSSKTGGMGIGLAICRSIIDAHRGSIEAANNDDGGATFCVSLPRQLA